MPKQPIQLRYWHIYLKPRNGVAPAHVTSALNKSKDWFKYDDNCYVLYSTAGIEQLTARYQPLVKPGGRLLIAPLELKPRGHTGWMPKAFWSWLKGHAGNKPSK